MHFFTLLYVAEIVDDYAPYWRHTLCKWHQKPHGNVQSPGWWCIWVAWPKYGSSEMAARYKLQSKRLCPWTERPDFLLVCLSTIETQTKWTDSFTTNLHQSASLSPSLCVLVFLMLAAWTAHAHARTHTHIFCKEKNVSLPISVLICGQCMLSYWILQPPLPFQSKNTPVGKRTPGPVRGRLLSLFKKVLKVFLLTVLVVMSFLSVAPLPAHGGAAIKFATTGPQKETAKLNLNLHLQGLNNTLRH